MFNNIHFAQPYFLYLLFIIPLLITWYWFKYKKNNAEIQISSINSFKTSSKTFRQKLYHVPFILRIMAIILLIIAIARPQSSTSTKNVSIKGIDIITALDISGSMLAEDFKPNRLEAAKDVVTKFINGRPNDRIGLVIFAGESFTQCPLTTDHTVLKALFKSVKSGIIEDGTAIGNGLATAVNRIKDSKTISKVIILLTDGVNNRGELDPRSAAEISKIFGIRVYTIGIGSMGMAPYPFQTPFGIQYQNVKVQIDEQLLKEIANTTGGKYFRATNKKKLIKIYDEIDKMEKSKIDVTKFTKKKEEFLLFALIACFLFIIEILLKNTVFKSIP